MAERLKAHAWKVCIGFKAYRGFESHPLRHKIKNYCLIRATLYNKPLLILIIITIYNAIKGDVISAIPPTTTPKNDKDTLHNKELHTPK